MFYNSEAEFIAWFNNKLPQSLDINNIKYNKTEVSK